MQIIMLLYFPENTQLKEEVFLEILCSYELTNSYRSHVCIIEHKGLLQVASE